MAFDAMDDLYLRIVCRTLDLLIPQELNCAAMPAPTDPELMEALHWFSQTEPLGWQTAITTPNDETRQQESCFRDQLSRVDELMLLHHLADSKRRKTN